MFFGKTKENYMEADVMNQAAKTEIWGVLIYCAIIFAVLYFLIIMPNKRRQAEYKKMLETLKVGSRILMSGGIYGTIKKIGEKILEVEIAKGVVVEIPKNAVANIE